MFLEVCLRAEEPYCCVRNVIGRRSNRSYDAKDVNDSPSNFSLSHYGCRIGKPVQLFHFTFLDVAHKVFSVRSQGDWSSCIKYNWALLPLRREVHRSLANGLSYGVIGKLPMISFPISWLRERLLYFERSYSSCCLGCSTLIPFIVSCKEVWVLDVLLHSILCNRIEQFIKVVEWYSVLHLKHKERLVD